MKIKLVAPDSQENIGMIDAVSSGIEPVFNMYFKRTNNMQEVDYDGFVIVDTDEDCFLSDWSEDDPFGQWLGGYTGSDDGEVKVLITDAKIFGTYEKAAYILDKITEAYLKEDGDAAAYYKFEIMEVSCVSCFAVKKE